MSDTGDDMNAEMDMGDGFNPAFLPEPDEPAAEEPPT